MKTYMITVIQNNSIIETMQSCDFNDFLKEESKVIIYNLIARIKVE